jgi:uncharacterized protein
MDQIDVILAYATPERQWEINLQVPVHANVAIVIRRSGLLEQCPSLQLENLEVGIHGHKVSLDTGVSAGDRVEVYRPLTIDPKEARRQRARKKVLDSKKSG